MKWGLGSAGKNGTEQAISNINQSPIGVTWRELGQVSATPMITEFAANNTFPIWLWWHCDAVTSADKRWVVEDDLAAFNWKGNMMEQVQEVLEPHQQKILGAEEEAIHQ